jgi:hypothetical protein
MRTSQIVVYGTWSVDAEKRRGWEPNDGFDISKRLGEAQY